MKINMNKYRLAAVRMLYSVLCCILYVSNISAATVQNYSFNVSGLSGILDETTDSCIGCGVNQLTETISIIVTNNTGSTYTCDGIIRFYSLSTGGASGFPVSDSNDVPSGTQVIIVSSTHHLSDGYALDKSNSSVSCGVNSSGGGGGGGSVTMSGNISYAQQSNGTVNLKVDKIENSSTQSTGALYLVLRATSTHSATASGYELSRVSLGGLNPNEYYSGVNVTGTFKAPPDGTYYIYLVLLNGSNVALDSQEFTSKTFTSSGGGGTSSGGGGNGLGVQLVGNYSYSIDFAVGTVNFSVDKVLNASTTRTTGTLRLELWASPCDYSSGGQCNGTQIAYDQLTGSSNGKLGPGQYIQNISQSVPIRHLPSPGTYYITLYVMEYDPQTCTAADYFCMATLGGFQKTLTVPSATSNADPSTTGAGSGDGGGGGAGGGGSGGGGATTPLMLGLLGVSLMIRRIQGD